ncbi:MAG TPA: redoxin domain-containing protein [Solirubrobacteraceae bacterium]|nr:redoxin domain-containing protein [Solirubrobacteraceae bacterium]
MRAPVDTIAAPPFLTHLKWVNVATLRMDKQLGNPVLVEFWDCCRANSMRTLPYLKAWHERYSEDGLRVVGIHSPGFDAGRTRDEVRAAVARLGIEYPVLVDPELEMWQVYENQGWPARYLFDQQGILANYHFGEGAYRETELAIQELLGIARDPLPPTRPEDVEGAELAPPSPEREGAYSGPYEAGGVWAVLDGEGMAQANGASIAVRGPGAYALIEHERHTAGVLELELGAGVRCLATCFTPGVSETVTPDLA